MEKPYVICLCKHLKSRPNSWPIVARFRTPEQATSIHQVEDVIIDEIERSRYSGELIAGPRELEIIENTNNEDCLVLKLTVKEELR